MGEFDSIKGYRIKIVSGKYEGCHGWTNTKKGSTRQMISVILQKNPPVVQEEEVRKRLSKISVRALLTEEEAGASCLEQAMLEQKKDINATMEKLVLEMTKCGLTPEAHGKEVGRILMSKWGLAKDAWQSMDEPPVRLVKFFGSVHN
jgi:hypothetical protein